MRNWKILAAGLFFTAAARPACAQQAAPADPMNEAAAPGVMRKAVDDVIRPDYAAMQASAATLSTAMTALCSAPSGSAATIAKAAFGGTVDAWSKIEIVQVGPVLEKNRFEHILFYPDRKGIGLKQVQALIAKADDKDATVEGVASKSVALMSLTALEYVLYGNGSDTLSKDKNGFR